MDIRIDSERIEKQVQVVLDAAGAPGAAISLTVDGQTWSAGIGWATSDRAVEMDASVRFSAYSVTKVIIAAMVMMLVEDGELNLDAPVQEYLPDFSLDSPVAIRQLLNHTGGLPDYGGLPEYHEAVKQHPETPWTPTHFLEATLGEGLLFDPGHGWRYSNIGYMLLRQVIERTTGGSLREAVYTFIAEPLQLDTLRVVEVLGDMDTLTPGYSRMLGTTGPGVNIIPRYHPGWVAHGLVASTAADLNRFLDALLGGRVVGAKSLAEMLMPVHVETSHPWMSEPSYGLGVMIDPGNRFGLVAGHSGGGPGYSTAAYHFPDVAGQRVTGVALVNRDEADTATDIVFSMVEMIGY